MHYTFKLILPIFTAIILLALATLYYFGIFGPHLILVKSNFSRLQNWQQNDQTPAFIAFQHSCSEILKRDPDSSFSYLTQSKKTQDWQNICLAANKITNPNPLIARQFFENWFEPYYILNNLNSHGLFTGYYLPVLQASLHQGKSLFNAYI